MSPPWVGALGWLSTLLLVTITVLLFLYVYWVWGVLFIVYGLIAIALLDVFSPFPSYKFCFKLIKKELIKQSVIGVLDNTNPSLGIELRELLMEVQKIEKKYLD